MLQQQTVQAQLDKANAELDAITPEDGTTEADLNAVQALLDKANADLAVAIKASQDAQAAQAAAELELGSIVPEDGIGQADVDEAYKQGLLDGAADVDITIDNASVASAAYADGVASVMPEDGIGSSDVEQAYESGYADGAASIDITSNDQQIQSNAYNSGYADGVASITPEDGISQSDVDAVQAQLDAAQAIVDAIPDDYVSKEESQAAIDAVNAEIYQLKQDHASYIDELKATLFFEGFNAGTASVTPEDGVSQADVDAAVAAIQTQLNEAETSLTAALANQNDGITQADVDAVQALLDKANADLITAGSELGTTASELQSIIDEINAAGQVVGNIQPPEDGITQANVDEIQTKLELAGQEIQDLKDTLANVDDGVTQEDVDAVQALLDIANETINSQAIGSQEDLDLLNLKDEQITDLQEDLQEYTDILPALGATNASTLQHKFENLLENYDALKANVQSLVDVAENKPEATFTTEQVEHDLNSDVEYLKELILGLDQVRDEYYSNKPFTGDILGFVDKMISNSDKYIELNNGIFSLMTDLMDEDPVEFYESNGSSVFDSVQLMNLHNFKNLILSYQEAYAIALEDSNNENALLQSDLDAINSSIETSSEILNSVVSTTEDAFNYIENGDFDLQGNWMTIFTPGSARGWTISANQLSLSGTEISDTPEIIYTTRGPRVDKLGKFLFEFEVTSFGASASGDFNVEISYENSTSNIVHTFLNERITSTGIFSFVFEVSAPSVLTPNYTPFKVTISSKGTNMIIDSMGIFHLEPVVTDNNTSPENLSLQLSSILIGQAAIAYNEELLISTSQADQQSQDILNEKEQELSQEAQNVKELIFKMIRDLVLWWNGGNNKYNHQQFFTHLNSLTVLEMYAQYNDILQNLYAEGTGISEDLSNTLSELAEATNDLKLATAENDSLINENEELKSQIDSLTSTIVSLMGSLYDSVIPVDPGVLTGIESAIKDLEYSGAYGGLTSVKVHTTHNHLRGDYPPAFPYNYLSTVNNTTIRVRNNTPGATTSGQQSFFAGGQVYDAYDVAIGEIYEITNFDLVDDTFDIVFNSTSSIANYSFSLNQGLYHHRSNSVYAYSVAAEDAFSVGDVVYANTAIPALSENDSPPSIIGVIKEINTTALTSTIPTHREIVFHESIFSGGIEELNFYYTSYFLDENVELLLGNVVTKFNDENNTNITSLEELVSTLSSQVESLENVNELGVSTLEAYRFTVFGNVLNNFSELDNYKDHRILMRNPDVPGYKTWNFENYVVKIVQNYPYDVEYNNTSIIEGMLVGENNQSGNDDFALQQNISLNDGDLDKAIIQDNRKGKHYYYRVIPNSNGIESVLKLRFAFGTNHIDADQEGSEGMSIQEYGIVDVDNNDVDNGYVFTVSIIRGTSPNKWEFVLTDEDMAKHITSSEEILNASVDAAGSQSGPKVQWELVQSNPDAEPQTHVRYGPDLIDPYNANLYKSASAPIPSEDWTITNGAVSTNSPTELGEIVIGDENNPSGYGIGTGRGYYDGVACSNEDHPNQSFNTEISLPVNGLKPNTTYKVSFPKPIEAYFDMETFYQLPPVIPGKNIFKKAIRALANLSPEVNADYTQPEGDYWCLDNVGTENAATIDVSVIGGTATITESSASKTDFRRVRGIFALTVQKEFYYSCYVGMLFDRGTIFDLRTELVANEIELTVETGYIVYVIQNEDQQDRWRESETLGTPAVSSAIAYSNGSLGLNRYVHRGPGNRAVYTPIIDFNNMSSDLNELGEQVIRIHLEMTYQFRIDNWKLAKKRYWVGAKLDVRLDVSGLTSIDDIAQAFVDEINNPNVRYNHETFGTHYRTGMARFRPRKTNISNRRLRRFMDDLFAPGDSLNYINSWYVHRGLMNATNNGDGTITVEMTSGETNYNGGDNFHGSFNHRSSELWGNNDSLITGRLIRPAVGEENFGEYAKVYNNLHTQSSGIHDYVYLPVQTGNNELWQYSVTDYISDDGNFTVWANPIISNGVVTDNVVDRLPETGDTWVEGGYSDPKNYVTGYSQDVRIAIGYNTLNFLDGLDHSEPEFPLNKEINYFAHAFSWLAQRKGERKVGSPLAMPLATLEVSFGNTRVSPYEDDPEDLAISNYNSSTLGTHKNLHVNQYTSRNLDSEKYIKYYDSPVFLTTGSSYSDQKIVVRAIKAWDHFEPDSSQRWRGIFYGLQINERIEETTSGGAGEIKILGEKISETITHDVINQSPVYGTALSSAYGGGKKRLVKNLQTGSTTVEPIIEGGYVCVGAYEDKPNNKIYYLVSEEGKSHKRDSIVEYDLMSDTTTTVYQDDNGSSHGDNNVILNFDSGHLITGINKIDDILYFTDNLNRPRKINVELAKKNEENIANPPYTFQDTYYNTEHSTVFVGGDGENPFKKGDYIYTQYNTTTTDNNSYNGYAEVLGVVVQIPQGLGITATNGSNVIQFGLDNDHGLRSDDAGKFIGIMDGNFPHYYEIQEVGNPYNLTLTRTFSEGGLANLSGKPLNINGTNVGGIITDCPWGNSVATANGKIFYANPKDAYSPLITFGSYKDKIKYFDVIKHQPTNKPYIEMFKDAGVASNNLINDTFQFKYRYVHRDNENTAYGPISDIAIDPAYASNAAVSAIDFNLLNNAIKVEYEDAICDVEQIEIVARKGNKGEFFLVDSIPNNFISYLKLVKNRAIADSRDHFKVESNYLDFYNSGTYPFIDRNDSTKLFDAVPILAKAQTILSNNRLAYGNIVEGYDNTDIAMDVSFSKEDAPVLEETIYDLPWTSNLDTFESNNSTFKQGGNGGRAQLDVAIDCNAVPLAGNKSQFVDINFWMYFQFRRSDPTWLYTPPRWSTAASFSLQFDATGAEDGEALASFIIGEVNSGNFRGGMYGGKGFMNVSNTNNRGTVTATTTSPGIVNLRITSANRNKDTDFGTLFDKELTWSAGSISNAGTLRSGTLGTATFKSGAHHNFGIAYFDETNRCSFVNTGATFGYINHSEGVDYNIGGSKGYAPFYSESNGPALGQGTNASINIYNKAPEWAKSYQLYYTGNTTVDEFIQMTVTDARAGSSANGDDQVYLSLNSLKGKNWSYNQTNNSNIGYNFVPGDRIRFISCVSGGSRRKFRQYVDLEIAGEDLFQGSGNAIGQEGYYIRISDPVNDAVEIEGDTQGTQDTVDLSVSNLRGNQATAGYNELIVEIYRPKRTKEEDTMVYYEIGDKYPIRGGYHIGDSTQAGEFLYNDTLGFEVSSDPATISLKTGDIYMKSRAMFADGTSDGQDPIIFFPEDYYLNDFHVTNSYSIGRINVVNRNSKARRLDASVYYSEPYSSTGSVNGLSSFNLATQPYFDYNKEFGSIQSLQTKDDDLIIFHENKVGRVLVGKDILNTASGDGLVSLSRDVIKNYVTVYSGEYGCCLQPESIVKANDRFYFVDIKKGAILRLSNDGITAISDYGMKDYFRDLGEMYVEYDPESQDNQTFNIVAGFDPKYNEYIVTMPAVYSRSDGSWDSVNKIWDTNPETFSDTAPKKVFEAKTIAFNTDIDRWTSFYGFYPEFYSRINNQFVGFQAGYMFKHNMTDMYYQDLYVNNYNRLKSNPNYNEIYNKSLNSSITFPFNAESDSVKNYNAISLESDTKLFASMETNIGQTARGESNKDGYKNVVSTSIGYRRVKGDGGSIVGKYLLGNKDASKGEISNFYSDVQKGDVVRVYVGYSTKNYYYVYDVVRKVSSNDRLLLSGDYETVNISHVEVIDFKTKEGIQYAQIPFAESSLADEDHEAMGDYNGDGSELIFGGSLITSKVLDANAREVVVELQTHSSEDLRSYNQSITVNNMVPGAKYAVLEIGPDNFKASIFGEPFKSEQSSLGTELGYKFTCVKPCSFTASKVAPLSYRVYAQDVDNGKITPLGYFIKANSSSKIRVSLDSNAKQFANNGLGNTPDKHLIFLAQESSVEGERIKGSYLMTTLSTNDKYSDESANLSRYKFNLYSASVDADKSELSGE